MRHAVRDAVPPREVEQPRMSAPSTGQTDDASAKHDAAQHRRYAAYLLALVVISIGLRFVFSFQVHGSAMFSDDYGHLKKSIYYPRGDLRMDGFEQDRQNQYTGLLYPLVVAPAQLFSDLQARHQAVFFINSLCAAAFALLACHVLVLTTGTRSWLIPLCLFASPIPILFSYYALTENLLFPLFLLIGVALLYLRDRPSSIPLWSLLVFGIVAAFLVRPAGTAAGFGAAAAIAFTFPLQRKYRLSLGGLIAFGTLGAYWTVSQIVKRTIDYSREGKYINWLQEYFSDPSDVLAVFKLALNQSWYILLGIGFWPVFFLLLRSLDGWQDKGTPAGDRRRTFFAYAAAAGLTSLAFCLMHLSINIEFKFEDAHFIYGRYNDPTALLLLVCGAIAMVRGGNFRERAQSIGTLVALGLLYGALSRVVAWDSETINQAGLYLFSNDTPWYFFSSHGAGYPIGLLVVAVAVCGFLLRGQPLVIVAVLSLLALNAHALLSGFDDAESRGARVSRALEGAAWINEHVPESECIAYDQRQRSKRAPRSIKKMYNVYLALHFAVAPRRVVAMNEPEKFHECRFVYSTADAEPAAHWREAWASKDYRVFELAPAS
ncbi:MAG: hypothetical protein KDD69_08090 [Bdellovibrionales bacterium]|nr:hypothetical protein [Bdellovibrionales bacterium]